MTNYTQQSNINNDLPALTKLIENIIDATQQIVTLYQQQRLGISAEDIIYLYCRWIGYIVDQKIIGDKKHLLALVIETIQQHIKEGNNLCQVVRLHKDQDTKQIDTLINAHGLIVIPVIKLIQFISNSINEALSIKLSIPARSDNKEMLLDDSIYKIFEHTFQTTVLAINELQIPNPLIFLLEHFSIIVGWLAGFFAQFNDKPTEIFLEKSFTCLKNILKIEGAETVLLH